MIYSMTSRYSPGIQKHISVTNEGHINTKGNQYFFKIYFVTRDVNVKVNIKIYNTFVGRNKLQLTKAKIKRSDIIFQIQILEKLFLYLLEAF